MKNNIHVRTLCSYYLRFGLKFKLSICVFAVSILQINASTITDNITPVLENETIQQTISGTVSDESGPLPGVNIIVKGTTNGTQTDFDGKYTIKALKEDKLIFRYLGYKPEEKIVGDSSIINVKMIEDGNRLDEIGPESQLQRHFYLTAGRQFKMQKKWVFVPSFFLMKTARTPIDFHMSALFNLDNKLSFGVGLRRTDAVTAQVRVKLFNFISVGYSFDFIISKLNKNMWYSHELTGGFNSCSNYGNSSTTSCATFE